MFGTFATRPRDAATPRVRAGLEPSGEDAAISDVITVQSPYESPGSYIVGPVCLAPESTGVGAAMRRARPSVQKTEKVDPLMRAKSSGSSGSLRRSWYSISWTQSSP